MKRNIAALLIGMVVCFFLSGCQSGLVEKTTEISLTHNKVVIQDPAVDLERGLIMTSGIGLPPKSSAGDAQANLLARRAAIVDGQRNLAQKLVVLERRAGLPQSDPTTVKNYTIVEEKQLSDGGYRVVLQMKLDAALLKRLR